MRNTISLISLILVIIGAINWLLVGIFNFNLVEYIFGVESVVNRIVYILVGVAGLISLSFIIDKKFMLYNDSNNTK